MKIAIQNTTTLDLFTSFLTLSADYKYVIPFSNIAGLLDFYCFKSNTYNSVWCTFTQKKHSTNFLNFKNSSPFKAQLHWIYLPHFQLY